MPKEVFAMVIQVFDDGSVNLTGPLDNRILCLGLLEAAKEKVIEHGKKKEQGHVTTPLDLSLNTLTQGRNAFDAAPNAFNMLPSAVKKP
jgi:hypothetical protein